MCVCVCVYVCVRVCVWCVVRGTDNVPFWLPVKGLRVTYTIRHMMYGSHEPNCMSYHEIIRGLVTSGMAHCLSLSYTFYVHLTSIRFEQPVCHESALKF